MLDEKKIAESKRRIEQMMKSGEIIKEKNGRFVEFFLNNSKNSFDSASLLFKASTNENLKKEIGMPNFNGFLWAINSSYYSMFYMVRALLENSGVKIKTEHSVHIAVFDALIYYFYQNQKIQKSIIEEFQEAEEESNEVLGKEKAKLIIEDYLNEREKRSRFTYEMGEIVMQNKAQTSLDRARRFNETLRKMIEL